MRYLVYIIYSVSLDRFYIGYTGGNIDARLRKHNANHKGFTGKKSGWVVTYIEEFETKEDAMKREKEIKGWKSKVKIQKLISTG
ncbi:MAG: excinuclease subunit [Chitinophagaceae bacterium]|nr:excinuclease subunit [Chitinophagaceae bacterium]